ncbi:hypothetical protein MTO96_006517 [Rhipicephalus appendiculatus]
MRLSPEKTGNAGAPQFRGALCHLETHPPRNRHPLEAASETSRGATRPQTEWTPVLKAHCKSARRVASAARALLARGHGCSPTLALRLLNGMATARILYGLSLASISRNNWDKLDAVQRTAIRQYHSLSRTSQVGPTLAEAGDMPLSLRADIHDLHIDAIEVVSSIVSMPMKVSLEKETRNDPYLRNVGERISRGASIEGELAPFTQELSLAEELLKG